MTARGLIAIGLGALALAAAGCGEKPAVTVYKQGTYQGKPDNLPWQSQPFDGSKGEWELAIDGRTKHQNEYERVQ